MPAHIFSCAVMEVEWNEQKRKENMNSTRKRVLIFLIAAVLWMAGCAPSAQGTPEAGPTSTATPDPLYSIHCVRHTGINHLCYPGEALIGDNERLEQAARDYCLYSALGFLCSVHLWADEASVAQTIPLTEAEKASRIASFAIQNIGTACFKVYEEGKAVYTTGDCRN